MPRAPKSRLYRKRDRWYADLRDFADVGGGQEAMKTPGTPRATEDRTIAEGVLTARLAELQHLRRDRATVEHQRRVHGATLGEVAKEHLILKASAGRFNERWLMTAEKYLTRAVAHFGARRVLTTIGVADLHRWIAELRRTPSKKGGTLAESTVRHHVNLLSEVYSRAVSLGYLPPGHNPVANTIGGDLPRHAEGEPDWLEVHEAAWLLDVVRRTPRGSSNTVPFLFELVATLLLTGGRKAEVAGLRAEDVSFDRRTVTFRPHADRPTLKTRSSERVVPLWPQLAEILGPYIMPTDHPPRSGLLFASRNRGGALVPVTNFDKALDTVAVRAGWQAGAIRAHGLRHTWAAARLQTLDRGEPVALYTVQREGGWSDDAMLQRIYGHLGAVRHRADVVEFRVEQHRAAIRERFGAVVPAHPVTARVTKALARAGGPEAETLI